MIELIIDEGTLTPTLGSPKSSGFDVTAATIKTSYKGDTEIGDEKLKKLRGGFLERGYVKIRPFERILFGTGLTVANLPDGVELQVRSRSGMTLSRGLIVANQPGTIDNDYRGEIGIILYNTTPFLITVRKGERIAQIVPIKVEKCDIVPVNAVSVTERNTAGFGSTGTL